VIMLSKIFGVDRWKGM